jgi:hypothetical protein
MGRESRRASNILKRLAIVAIRTTDETLGDKAQAADKKNKVTPVMIEPDAREAHF